MREVFFCYYGLDSSIPEQVHELLTPFMICDNSKTFHSLMKFINHGVNASGQHESIYGFRFPDSIPYDVFSYIKCVAGNDVIFFEPLVDANYLVGVCNVFLEQSLGTGDTSLKMFKINCSLTPEILPRFHDELMKYLEKRGKYSNVNKKPSSLDVIMLISYNQKMYSLLDQMIDIWKYDDVDSRNDAIG